MRVLFLHPDLGIGGAERLVCDAALALQKKGHKVSFITTYHDPGHCFPETRDGTFPGMDDLENIVMDYSVIRFLDIRSFIFFTLLIFFSTSFCPS